MASTPAVPTGCGRHASETQGAERPIATPASTVRQDTDESVQQAMCNLNHDPQLLTRLLSGSMGFKGLRA